MNEGGSERARAGTAPAAALTAALLALAVRSLGFEGVFLGEEGVVFAFGDPDYHLRLALYALRAFPEPLRFDPYLNFPDGAAVPWPPLYDLMVAGSTRLLGGDAATLERVAAWWPPALGAATAAAVAWMGWMAAGGRAAWAAGLLFAVLPASVAVSRVGYADHHAAVAAIGAAWLAFQMSLLRASTRRRASPLAAGLAVARAAMILTWAGSLAYVAVADVSLVLLAALSGSRRALGAQAASLLVSAALILPFVASSHGQSGGPFSGIELSWMHLVACVCLGVWSAAATWAFRSAAPEDRAQRLVACAATGAVVAGAALLLPGVRGALFGGGSFVTTSDAWGLWSATNPEQAPLLAGAPLQSWGVTLMGHWVWLIPAAPLAVGVRAWRERRPELGILAVWVTAFGALALAQARFANDLAPGFSVAAVLSVAAAGRALAVRAGFRAPARTFATVVAGLLLWAPCWGRYFAPVVRGTLQAVADPEGARGRARRSPEASMVRFARQLRAATAETAGFFGDGRPEYGVICDPSLGHALHYVARRATTADNFGPHVGEKNLLASLHALLAPPNDATLETLDALGARYVVTSWQPRWHEGSLMHRLHALDARGADLQPALAHFRLVDEGPVDGRPLAALFAPTPPGVVSYKLFERVAGAVLEVPAPPGTRVHARVEVHAPSNRRFVQRSAAVADADGLARVPAAYATGGEGPVRAAPYRIRIGDVRLTARVSEADVLEGRAVSVRTTAPGP